MALKPVKKAVKKAVKLVEPVVESEPVVEIKIEVKPPKRETRTVVLQGRKGSSLQGSVNGAMFASPCGVEIEVNDSTYHAVAAYIIEER